MTDVISDADEFRAHANKTFIDLDDVKLAASSKTATSFVQPPPRQVRLKRTFFDSILFKKLFRRVLADVFSVGCSGNGRNGETKK